MMIQAVLSNPSHPEYGVATIPFPIPHDQYAHCMELLAALEIGDAVKTDCKVEKIDSFYTVLKRAEMLTVNVEELNYLAKRLDSFDTGEAAQFQAMAHKLELFELKDLINLTFCCQQATVITDFSDLAAIGRDHYMNLHGGSAGVDELNALDGKETARQLIESGSGTITPYGVVYDNGMKLEQLYDGKHFPAYLYEPAVLMVALTSHLEPEDTKDITFTVHKKDLEESKQILEEHKETLRFDHIETDESIGKVSIVGAGLMSNCGVAARMFEALYEAGINIQMISTSEIKVSVLVDERDADRAVQAIHDRFFSEFGNS